MIYEFRLAAFPLASQRPTRNIQAGGARVSSTAGVSPGRVVGPRSEGVPSDNAGPEGDGEEQPRDS